MANVLRWELEQADDGFNFWLELERAESDFLEHGHRAIFVNKMVREFGFTLLQAEQRADDLNDSEGNF